MSDRRGGTDPKFNVLTDPWLPLMQADGSTVWASFVEVLCGEKDGIDLDYPRDDFRIYGRLLLSALVQALLPAKTKRELVERLGRPLRREELMAAIAPLLSDFELFGPRPFLQVVPSGPSPSKGAASFVFPGEDLFQAPVAIDAVALPIALLALFIEQTYAGGAGRGYGAGPGGQPGAFSLVDPGTIRAAAWANTLSVDRVLASYAPEDPRPWSNAKRAASPRAAIGLATGLFFQPRSTWLEVLGQGRCSFSGLSGPLVRLAPLGPKSELTKKASGAEDLWQHPCAPLAVNSAGIGAVRLHADRPAWTGLAQLLEPISKGKNKVLHPKAGPAPVLLQWRALEGRPKRPRLLVLDFDRDKANVKRRFYESVPLTEGLLDKPEVIERLRALVDDAQTVSAVLVRGLKLAHDARKVGGLALVDAESQFWARSEPDFFAWLDAAVHAEDGVPDAEMDRHTDAARARMAAAIRARALEIFDAHVSMSEFDPRKQARVALARRNMRDGLYPKTHNRGARAAEREVTK